MIYFIELMFSIEIKSDCSDYLSSPGEKPQTRNTKLLATGNLPAGKLRKFLSNFKYVG